MEVIKGMFITSSVVSAGLLVAWGITTGVTCGKGNSIYNRRKERYDMIRDLGGEAAAAKAEVSDAVSDGIVSEEVGTAMKQVIENKGPASTGMGKISIGTNSKASLNKDVLKLQPKLKTVSMAQLKTL